MSSTALCQPDDNLVPGQTYTFQLKNDNLVWIPSANTIQQDLQQNAPTFVSNLQVLSPTLTALYNCQFSYSGDGTDVVTDVANELIQAIKQGSNDSMVFVGAVADTAQSITVDLATAAPKIADTVGNAVNSAITGAAKTTADAAQKLLDPIEILLFIVIGAVVLIIFTAGKAGGVSASETGLNIGGSK